MTDVRLIQNFAMDIGYLHANFTKGNDNKHGSAVTVPSAMAYCLFEDINFGISQR